MGQVVSAAPEGESAVHPLGGEESHFYWAEEGAEFNLEGLLGKGKRGFV